MQTRVLAFDGDDTLWHNESRFKLTQGALRDLVHRHVPDADVDSHLFDVEMRNLKLYGVEASLRDISAHYSLLLITKGDLFDQESKLARSGLADLFTGVEILSDKTVDSYRSLLRRRDIRPEEFVMVGNSLRSDIAPVVALGARAVHIPYHITWDHERMPDDSLPSSGWYRLGGIGELVGLLESIDQRRIDV